MRGRILEVDRAGQAADRRQRHRALEPALLLGRRHELAARLVAVRAVAPRALRPVERHVGEPVEVAGPAGVGEGADAGARREVARPGERLGGDSRARALGRGGGGLDVGVGQDPGELLAAHARDESSSWRATERSRSPTSASTASPAGWPRLSFTTLKWSRSSTTTLSGRPWRSARAAACSRCSVKARWFARPVRWSVAARWRSRSLVAARAIARPTSPRSAPASPRHPPAGGPARRRSRRSRPTCAPRRRRARRSRWRSDRHRRDRRPRSAPPRPCARQCPSPPALEGHERAGAARAAARRRADAGADAHGVVEARDRGDLGVERPRGLLRDDPEDGARRVLRRDGDGDALERGVLPLEPRHPRHVREGDERAVRHGQRADGEVQALAVGELEAERHGAARLARAQRDVARVPARRDRGAVRARAPAAVDAVQRPADELVQQRCAGAARRSRWRPRSCRPARAGARRRRPPRPGGRGRLLRRSRRRSRAGCVVSELGEGTTRRRHATPLAQRAPWPGGGRHHIRPARSGRSLSSARAAARRPRRAARPRPSGRAARSPRRARRTRCPG